MELDISFGPLIHTRKSVLKFKKKKSPHYWIHPVSNIYMFIFNNKTIFRNVIRYRLKTLQKINYVPKIFISYFLA